MNYQPILDSIYQDIKKQNNKGEVATYIPELAKVAASKFGIHISCLKGKHYSVGDSEEKFSIQSIVKVLSLALAVKLEGTKILKRVGVEPSGDPFNSLTQLEFEQGIPRNPLINAGALVICDILLAHLKNPKADFLQFVRHISAKPDLDYDYKVAASEKAYGYRNAALLNLMKSFGNINHKVEEVLDFYFHQCALAMSCREVADAFLFFANVLYEVKFEPPKTQSRLGHKLYF